jgi:hypothetical protein
MWPKRWQLQHCVRSTLDSKKITCLSGNPELKCREQKRPSLLCIVSRRNPGSLTIIIILSFHLLQVSPFRLSDQNFICMFHLSHTCCMPHPVLRRYIALRIIASKSNEFRKSSQILAILIGIRELPSSKLGRDVDYHKTFSWFSPIFLVKCRIVMP